MPLLVILQQGSLAHSGWVFGASAIGGVLSSAWIAYRPLKHLDEIIVATTVIVGLALITLAFSPSFVVTILAAFVIGVADGPLLAATFAVRSREAAPEIRSVVFTTAASIKTSLYAIAAAILGAVSDHGVGLVFGIAAIIQVIALVCAKVTTTAMLSRANVR